MAWYCNRITFFFEQTLIAEKVSKFITIKTFVSFSEESVSYERYQTTPAMRCSSRLYNYNEII
jgi:hypothetical protein